MAHQPRLGRRNTGQPPWNGAPRSPYTGWSSRRRDRMFLV